MIVKLSRSQFHYLNNSLPEKRPDLKSKLQIRKEDHFVFVEVDEDVADEIRDWAGEELQTKGFAPNYELTSKGRILEELIDAFYIE